MKNQENLIVIIVACLLGLGVSGYFFFTKPEPHQPTAPQPVVQGTPKYPDAPVSMANGLGGGGGGGGFGGMGGGFGGGFGGMGGGPRGPMSMNVPGGGGGSGMSQGKRNFMGGGGK